MHLIYIDDSGGEELCVFSTRFLNRRNIKKQGLHPPPRMGSVLRDIIIIPFTDLAATNAFFL